MDPRTAPPPDTYLRELIERFRPLRDGEVSGPTEALEDGEAEPFGIAMATVDGQLFSAGDDAKEFTIQSISKPFLYGLALDRLGRAARCTGR